MQRRSFIRSMQAAISGIPSFLAWLFKAEKLEDASSEITASPAGGHTSFLRWVLSREELELDEPIRREPKKASFFPWLFAPERLESVSSEPGGDERGPSFVAWLIASERLEPESAETTDANPKPTDRT